jgi:hypothetical protein
MKKIILTAVFFFTIQFLSVLICNAQTVIADSTVVTDSVTKKEKISLYIGAAYSTPLHYYGRTDSLKSSAFLPIVFIQLGKHFSITPSVIFIKNSATNFDYAASIINASYSFGKKKGIAGSISADKFFYKNQSKLVRSAQLGQAGFTLAHLNRIVNINIGASAAFSKASPDFFANAGLDHQFKFVKKKNVFLIKPAVVANAGTQNFTNSYYKNSGSILFPGSQQLVTETSKKFSLLSYEVKLDAIYAIKRFIVSITPGYVLPQNIITVPNNPSLSENAKNLFFCNAVVVYRITR